jgi:hypothetical protein
VLDKVWAIVNRIKIINSVGERENLGNLNRNALEVWKAYFGGEE